MKKLRYAFLFFILTMTCQPKETKINFCRLNRVYYRYEDKSDPQHVKYVTAELHLTYDSRDRLTTVDESGLTWPTLLAWTFTSHFIYDDQNKLMEIQKSETGGIQPQETRKIFFYEDRWIKAFKLLFKNTNGLYILTDSCFFTYNSFNQLIKQKNFHDGLLTDSIEFLYDDSQTKNFYASISKGEETDYLYDGHKNPYFELSLTHLKYDWVRFSGFEVDYRTANSLDIQNYYCYQYPGETLDDEYTYNDAQYPVYLTLNCGSIHLEYQNIYLCK